MVVISHPPSPPSRRANLHEMSAYDFIQAQLHEVQAVALDDDEEFHDAQDKEVANDDPADTVLINSAKSSSKLQPGDIRHVMSNAPSATMALVRNLEIPRASFKHLCISPIVYLLTEHV
jgi:hypothetical protein